MTSRETSAARTGVWKPFPPSAWRIFSSPSPSSCHSFICHPWQPRTRDSGPLRPAASLFRAPARPPLALAECNMARAARALWPAGRLLAWRLGSLPRASHPVQGRAGLAGAAGGPDPAAAARWGRPRVLGAAALALGGALGLYQSARWHLQAQDLQAQRLATEVIACPGWVQGSARLPSGPPVTLGEPRGLQIPRSPAASSSGQWEPCPEPGRIFLPPGSVRGSNPGPPRAKQAPLSLSGLYLQPFQGDIFMGRLGDPFPNLSPPSQLSSQLVY